MAHDLEIRFKCRALFEVMDMSLTDINKQETVGVSTLSDWKNDDRVEFGGIWVQGCKAGKVEQTTERLRKELEATSIYDEMKNKLTQHYGISKSGGLEVGGMLDLSSSNAEIQAKAETDVTLLATIGADYFDSQLFKNSILSSIVLNNQVKNDPTKVRQADIKASSEIHKIAKEARFGKSPETVIFNANGNYSPEELADLSIEQLEELMKKEQSKTLDVVVIEKESV